MGEVSSNKEDFDWVAKLENILSDTVDKEQALLYWSKIVLSILGMVGFLGTIVLAIKPNLAADYLEEPTLLQILAFFLLIGFMTLIIANYLGIKKSNDNSVVIKRLLEEIINEYKDNQHVFKNRFDKKIKNLSNIIDKAKSHEEALEKNRNPYLISWNRSAKLELASKHAKCISDNLNWLTAYNGGIPNLERMIIDAKDNGNKYYFILVDPNDTQVSSNIKKAQGIVRGLINKNVLENRDDDIFNYVQVKKLYDLKNVDQYKGGLFFSDEFNDGNSLVPLFSDVVLYCDVPTKIYNNNISDALKVDPTISSTKNVGIISTTPIDKSKFSEYIDENELNTNTDLIFTTSLEPFDKWFNSIWRILEENTENKIIPDEEI